MRNARVSDKDLRESVRQLINEDNFTHIKEIVQERNGEMVPKGQALRPGKTADLPAVMVSHKIEMSPAQAGLINRICTKSKPPPPAPPLC